MGAEGMRRGSSGSVSKMQSDDSPGTDPVVPIGMRSPIAPLPARPAPSPPGRRSEALPPVAALNPSVPDVTSVFTGAGPKGERARRCLMQRAVQRSEEARQDVVDVRSRDDPPQP